MDKHSILATNIKVLVPAHNSTGDDPDAARPKRP
jgi:hypothetical protein